MPFQIGAAKVGGVWGGWDPSKDVHVIQDPTFWKALRHLPQSPALGPINCRLNVRDLPQITSISYSYQVHGSLIPPAKPSPSLASGGVGCTCGIGPCLTLKSREQGKTDSMKQLCTLYFSSALQ